jgi:hypothetical protein
MGKGRIDRNPSNAARRRRKARRVRFFNHVFKHPNYWNSDNPILTFQLNFIFVFFVLIEVLKVGSDKPS